MADLKAKPENCPLCESDSIAHGWQSPGMDGSMSTGSVECCDCDCMIWKATEAEAIAAWNTRISRSNQKCWPVVKRDYSGQIMMVFAVCTTEEKAVACADNANQWYGDEHPLTPLTVDTSLPMIDPRPFPVDALAALKEAS